jgi:Fungal chitosanase of glycosyl hydrolase group 75
MEQTFPKEKSLDKLQDFIRQQEALDQHLISFGAGQDAQGNDCNRVIFEDVDNPPPRLTLVKLGPGDPQQEIQDYKARGATDILFTTVFDSSAKVDIISYRGTLTSVSDVGNPITLLPIIETFGWQILSEMNAYHGLMPNSFKRIAGTSAFPSGAIHYESKFDIDADGSGPNLGDPAFQKDTSLHDGNGALNATTYPFGVIPLPRDGGFSKVQDVGLGLGDVGIAFFQGRSATFVYGDEGPSDKIGEGSVILAKSLGIDGDPVNGGMQKIPPGVVHIAFPGSRDLSAGFRKTSFTATDIDNRAKQLLGTFVAANKPSVG